MKYLKKQLIPHIEVEMKINITLGGSGYKSGFVNIDPTLQRMGEEVILENANDDQTNVIKADIRNLSEVSQENECTEIYAADILDYLQLEESKTVVSHWVSRLRHGGKIAIGGTDIEEVCRIFKNGKITTEDFNQVVHGTFEKPWSVKLSHRKIEDLIGLLQANGIKITKKRIEGINMIVEGERP